MKNNLKKKVILGLSGGVDSTTAALLLLKKGFNVTGLYFDIEKNGNINTSKVLKAKAIAKKLKIDFIYKNLSTDFENKVIKDFCQNYLSGKTPNPCVIRRFGDKRRIGVYKDTSESQARGFAREHPGALHCQNGRRCSRSESKSDIHKRAEQRY